MSLIKAVDVPKHMADRLRSRRIAARLSGGAKQPTVPTTKPLAVPPSRPPLPPIRRPRPNCLVPPSCSTFSQPRFALDFLSNLVSLPKFMRLSLRKTAHLAAGEWRSRKSGPVRPLSIQRMSTNPYPGSKTRLGLGTYGV